MPESTADRSEFGRIDTIVRTCRLLDRISQANADVPRSHSLYYRLLADYFARIAKARDEGGFIAAHTVWFPVELLYSMDVIPMHIEITAWMTALFSGHYCELLVRAGAEGIAPETCSPYRVLIGALAGQGLPQPSVVFSSNLICDNNAKIGEVIRHTTQSPGFFLDFPFRETEPENEYLKKELEEMILFLEERSGRESDPATANCQRQAILSVRFCLREQPIYVTRSMISWITFCQFGPSRFRLIMSWVTPILIPCFSIGINFCRLN